MHIDAAPQPDSFHSRVQLLLMIRRFNGILPDVHETAWVAESADVIGDVVLGEEASIFFQCVVRGDVNFIRIGARTNVQDHCTIHVSRDNCPTHIGDDVTVGHRAIVHGATVESRALVGMGAIILDRAVIGEGAVVGAGALVTPGTEVPDGAVAMGSPAKVVRDVSEKERAFFAETITGYMELSKTFKAQGD